MFVFSFAQNCTEITSKINLWQVFEVVVVIYGHPVFQTLSKDQKKLFLIQKKPHLRPKKGQKKHSLIAVVPKLFNVMDPFEDFPESCGPLK